MNAGMSERPATASSADRGTMIRLLNAAERLFGEHGYDGVGMRELAEKAHVNLGAATYHFGSKKALYLEAFLRRFRPINAERLRLLEQAQAQGTPLTVERIAECLARPSFSLAFTHPSFNALQARNLLTPPAFLHEAVIREFEPNMRAFAAALQTCLPQVPERLVHIRIMFAMGSLLMFSTQIRRMRVMRNPATYDAMLKELVRFIAGGLQSDPADPAMQWPAPPRARRTRRS